MSATRPIPSQAPLAFDATPDSLLQDARTIIKTTTDVWNSIAQAISRENATIDTVILPVAINDNESKSKSAFIHFAASTHPSEAMRNASNEGDRLLDQLNAELYTRDDMYQLVDIVMKQTDPSKVDSETYRFLQKHHAEFVRNGCGLPQSEKEKFGAHKIRLHELTRQYLKNLNSEQNGLWFSPEELEGVPANTLDKLQKGEGDNAGKLWVTMKTPHTTPVLRFANPESTRKKVYTANLNRVPDNIALHREIILLRDALARQLGFKNWADQRTSEKTVGSTKRVTDFLDRIQSPLMVGAKKEADELLKLKKAGSPDNDEIRFYHWDQAFYERIRDEKTASLDLKYVSEFFELSYVLGKMLSIYERLFDIEFELVTPERYESITRRSADTMVWQEDVKLYILWDVAQGTSFLGYLYFDLHPRPGKYTHAGHYCLQPGFLKQGGTRWHPSSALVMNYAKPSDGTPTLMALNDVRSLFHELGHAMHNLLSLTQFARFHGSKVDRDFVETPSLMFEHFFWTEGHIKDVACHYSYISDNYKMAWEVNQNGTKSPQPPRELTDELINDILSLKLSNKPLGLARQLHFALYDMLVHDQASTEELEAMDFCEVFNKKRNELTSLQGGEALGEGWNWCHGESCYRAIMSNYDAGYYAYLMGRAWALDIFETNFQADTMSKSAGRRYREKLLQPGASQPEMKTLHEYLEREPNLGPYYRWLGVNGE